MPALPQSRHEAFAQARASASSTTPTRTPVSSPPWPWLPPQRSGLTCRTDRRDLAPAGYVEAARPAALIAALLRLADASEKLGTEGSRTPAPPPGRPGQQGGTPIGGSKERIAVSWQCVSLRRWRTMPRPAAANRRQRAAIEPPNAAEEPPGHCRQAARKLPKAAGKSSESCLRPPGRGRDPGHLVQEPFSGQPALMIADQERQVLGHEAGFHGLDADLSGSRRSGSRAGLSSSSARCLSPRVQAKIEDRVGRGGLRRAGGRGNAG